MCLDLRQTTNKVTKIAIEVMKVPKVIVVLLTMKFLKVKTHLIQVKKK